MITIISPAKNQLEDVTVLEYQSNITTPIFEQVAIDIACELKEFNVAELANLLGVSSKIAETNAVRFKEFTKKNISLNKKPAIFCYNGDVYKNLSAKDFTNAELNFAQENLCIITAMYGVLRPLDNICNYRLEMATKFQSVKLGSIPKEFWQPKLTEYFSQRLAFHESKTIINLCSTEYSTVLIPAKLKGEILNVHFKNFKDGHYKTVGILAKRARGLMAKYIIENNLTKPEQLKSFNIGGYQFSLEHSNRLNYFFHASN